MKTNKGDWFITNDNVVYVSLGTHLLKASPNYNNEDRRLFDFELKGIELRQINKLKGLEIINKQYHDYQTEWEFNGKRYKVLKSSEKNSTFFNRERTPKRCTLFTFVHEYTNREGKIRQFCNGYYLGWFRGKLYWVEDVGHFPRLMLYKFEKIEKEPRFNDFAQWTHAKCVKIIYDADKNTPI